MVTIMLIKLMGLMIKIKRGQLASDGPRERTQRKEETGVCDNPTPNTSGKSERSTAGFIECLILRSHREDTAECRKPDLRRCQL